MTKPDENYSDPLLDLVAFHDGRDGVGWHGGPGWYYTINAEPERGTFGPFGKFGDAMEHADKEVFRLIVCSD